MELTGWSKSEAVGRLHILWWRAIQYDEDGDLSKTPLRTVFREFETSLSDEAIKKALIDSGFLSPTLKLTNWLKRVRIYMTLKYKTSNPSKLKKMYPKTRGVSRPVLEPSLDTPKNRHALPCFDLTKKGFKGHSSSPSKKPKTQMKVQCELCKQTIPVGQLPTHLTECRKKGAVSESLQ